MKANEIIEKLFNENGINETIEVMGEMLASHGYFITLSSEKGKIYPPPTEAELNNEAGKENRNGNS